MKVTAKLAESLEGTDPTDDLGILIKLSAVHGVLQNLASERDEILHFLPERRKRIEQIAAQVEARRKALTVQAADTVSVDVESARPLVDVEARVPPQAAATGVLLTLETHTKGRIGAAGDDGSSLAERASRLASALSPNAFRIYRSLVQARKWPWTIGLNGDSCSGCNMRLPSGLLGEIRRVTTLHRCPFCKRVIAAADTMVSS